MYESRMDAMNDFLQDNYYDCIELEDIYNFIDETSINDKFELRDYLIAMCNKLKNGKT